jgi:hypothetical protein
MNDVRVATELRLGQGDFCDYEHSTPQGAEKIGKWPAGRLARLMDAERGRRPIAMGLRGELSGTIDGRGR